jgi:NADH:ubiquinone oxidoreductase subunit 6 (subunit J)
MGTPQEFGKMLFADYWFPVEIASLLLLAALIGALYLGQRKERS